MKLSIKEIKKHKIIMLKIAIIAVFVSIFFFPSYVPFEVGEDNLFTLLINGEVMGSVTDKSVFDTYITESRRELALEDDNLLFMDFETEIQSSQVLFGVETSKSDLCANITSGLSDSIKVTMMQCYTVKIGDYMLNLGSQGEVVALLQAAVDKYDKSGNFQVGLGIDTEREFNVLTANVVDAELVESVEVFNFDTGAGIQTTLVEMFENVEPAVEKGFDDYEQGMTTVDFMQEIEVVEAYLDKNEVTSLEEAVADITVDKAQNEIYTVISGDTLSEIAIKTNIPIDEILSLNSDTLSSVNSTLKIGQELIVTVPKAKLSVEWSETVYLEEEYEADIIYVDNDSWYTTQQVTLQNPSAGFRKVMAEIKYINDDQVEKVILKEDVIMEAVPKIVERGTKIPPTYIKPLSGGRISSYFGYRDKPNAAASSYHQGIDWATPTGTTIVASSGGTVTRAGWLGTYGYVIYIQHPDGKETRYAHLSKVLVKVGQTVSQGGKIALSGNTGNSTGPHLHFEIRQNGTAINPLNVIN